MALITETYLRVRSVRGLPNPFSIGGRDMLTPAAADFLKTRGISIQRSTPEQADPPDHRGSMHIPVGVSARHLHLSPEHIAALFGPGYSLSPLRQLSQPGQFAAQETITLIGPKGTIPNVRILGPSRGATQVEISRTDSFLLGVHPPVRLSGHIESTPGITLVGAKGTVELHEGVIVAKNHVHMSPQEAVKFQVANGDRLIVRTLGDRPLFFADVIVRVNERFALDFHIDTDEANAAGLKTGDVVEIIGKNGEITGAVRG